METKNIKRIVGLCVLLLCFQQVTFAQGLIWKSQVIKRPDDAIIYKTKINGSYELPTWSTTEEEVLFTLSKGGYRSEYSNLYLLDTKKGDVQAITSESNKRIQSSNGEVFTEDEILYTVLSGKMSKLKMLTSVVDDDEVKYKMAYHEAYNKIENCFNPALSPDGKWLLYDAPSEVLLRDGTPIQQIYKMNVTTGELSQLTTGMDHKRRAKWSPDGHVILYEQYDGQFREWSLYTTDYNGRWNRRLTESVGDETYGSFSPDSEWVVYSSNRLLNDEEIEKNILIIKNIYSGTTYELTNAGFYDTAPDWSALNNRIVFETSPKEPESYGGSWIAIIEVSEEMLNEEE